MNKDIYFDLSGSWKLTYMPNCEYKKLSQSISSSIELNCNILDTNHKDINVTVPGVFEQDLFKAGIIDDPYFGLNIIDIQELEAMHLFYYREFDLSKEIKNDIEIRFEGIDTFASIFINGCHIGDTDNMLIPHELKIPSGVLKDAKNEIFIHITPAPIVTRDYPVPAICNSLEYIQDLLYARKAPSMGGWDIMPRALGGGLWRDVYLVEKKEDRIDNVFLYACNAIENGDTFVRAKVTASFSEDLLSSYKIIIKGECKDSRFETSFSPKAALSNTGFNIPCAKLWWPRNYGEPNLYNITVYLEKNGVTVDEYSFKTGLRTIKLDRTSTTTKDGDGEFCFIINGKKIFYLGTNWVPLDAFHSNDIKRVDEAIELVLEAGCNGVRCWGGNVYESDRFYELCDENGIMIWQDFAMACGVFPQEQRFYDMMAKEVEVITKRLRNHPAIILWAGDNECDYSYMNGNSFPTDPNKNVITRKVIPEVLNAHDFTRPYLPSSPYIDEDGFKAGGGDGFGALSEDHLWGPRDYYKGPYYKNTICHFASETGYHGCPSPSSLSKFLSENRLWPWYDVDEKEKNGRIVENVEWRVHSTSPELREDAPFSYRIRLMVNQIKTLFGDVPMNLRDFAIASQISQGEAFKFFIERFRITKWRRTGIIWWNIVDGWPQISDAVVDYYHNKKMAFYYIKRSQQKVAFMFDEPNEIENGSKIISLVGVSDNQAAVTCAYKVIKIGNVGIGEQEELKPCEVLSGSCYIGENSTAVVNCLEFDPHAYYKIEWTATDANGDTFAGANSYLAGDPIVSLTRYIDAMKIAGFFDFTE